jgi:predicted deacylase
MSDLPVTGGTVQPGERRTVVAEVQLGDRTVDVPVIVVQGANDGPRVAVTAGIHGAEYVGIEAARRVGMSVDPNELSGTLVVVPISNTRAFFTRSIYVSGLTDENLNRLFPGDSRGSPSQMLADWLFTAIIRPSQFYIDMHGGDMIEALVPFVLAPEGADPAVNAASHAMAAATGIQRIIAGDVAGSTVGAAVAAGIPSILAEIGGQGVWDEEHVTAHMESTLRVLRHLGVLTGEVRPVAGQRTYHTFAWMRSEERGLFHPTVRVGARVQRGEHLGTVADYFGTRLQQIEAVTAGEIVFLVTSLAINANDPLLAIGA